MATRCLYRSLKLSPHVLDWHCPEVAASRAGLCIFHDPDPGKDVEALAGRLNTRLSDEDEAGLRFDGAVFPEGISFAGVVFRHSASFFVAEFQGSTISFADAEFVGPETWFQGARFLGRETFFGGARFAGQLTSFRGVEFQSQEMTSFIKAVFRADTTSFFGAEFRSAETSFNRAEFHGEVVFMGRGPKEVFFGGRTDFKVAAVGEKGTLVFHWVDLSRAEFLRADISNAQFRDVTWDRPRDRKAERLAHGGWRRRVYDETLWREQAGSPNPSFLSDLGRLYRRLKVCYRESGEHQLVGDFHYGLMEVQWQQREAEAAEQGAGWFRRKWRKWVSWEAAYRTSSGYGEDEAWAALVLAALLAGFAAGYWWLGVPAEAARGPWWRRGMEALLYSVQAGTHGWVDFYAKPGPATGALGLRWLYLAESILVPVQLGFFVFALRNRFRR